MYRQRVHRCPETISSRPSALTWLRLRFVVLLSTASLVTASCDFLDGLLDVDTPSIVEADDVLVPSQADMLVRSAIADFECAFGDYIAATGLMGRQLSHSGLSDSQQRYEIRDLSPRIDYTFVVLASCGDGTFGVYTPLSTARWQADNTLTLLEGWTDDEVPQRESLIATTAAFSGYSHLLLGESMCTAAFDLGPELTREQIFERAETRFDRAITAAEAAGPVEVLNLARVGRARTRLNLGNHSGAMADALIVPPGFIWNATYSAATPRRENRIFRANYQDDEVSVQEEFRNLTYEGVPDPRVTAVDANRLGRDGRTPMWVQMKYTGRDSPIPIARWAEAQLIVAEGALMAGDQQAAIDIINALHNAVELPEFSSSDSDEILEQIVYERQAELYLESQHLGDLNRYGLELVPAPGTPNPGQGGGFYGDLSCIPLHDMERLNNPSIN